MSTVLEAPATEAVELDGSWQTHIVNCPPDKPSAEAWVTEARVFGLELEALCGFRWVAERDPERHPICQVCVEVAGILAVEVGE